MKKLIVLIVSLAFATPGAFAASMGDTGTPIKVAVNDWSGQQLSAYLLGEVLKKTGYKVEYVTAGTIPQLTGIGQGDLHVNPEIWENNAPEIFPKLVSEGKIVNVGKEGLSAREGWMYPAYMKEQCPGLPSWEALYDCAQAFGNPETFPKGRLITYPADWGTRSKDLVEQIKLPFVPVAGGSEGAMMAELKAAYESKEPILIMFWEPHWIHAGHDMEWIEWPTNSAACEQKAGLSSGSMEGPCGFHQADVFKVVWNGFKDKWPAAYALVDKFHLTNADQNPLIHEVDNEGRKPEEVAAEWVSKNKSTWQPWVDAAKK